jgi:hypothetical protein
MVGGRSRATEVVLFKKIRLGMRLVGAARSVPSPPTARHSERSEESPRKPPSRVHASRHSNPARSVQWREACGDGCLRGDSSAPRARTSRAPVGMTALFGGREGRREACKPPSPHASRPFTPIPARHSARSARGTSARSGGTSSQTAVHARTHARFARPPTSFFIYEKVIPPLSAICK